ncbi:hypothetical protein [Methanobrevibacter olleyae]|uniref:Adhesin-like protein n=1 Tax=Methanobrevibacter olleyae TaxID=294671 RepID=A0A126R0C1_METOL|nr:hypothetical protein [Methanobrevibacter olleyae]AMK15823.1 adhesin-like protein [Methanobrevibacter olleyae]
MKPNYFILVLVLISIISIGAVSAVDDTDIGTSVLETTDDLSVDDVSADESIDESSPVEENIDLPADDVSVDDDLSESNIVDESEDLSIDSVSVDGDLGESNIVDELSINKNSKLPATNWVNPSNVYTFFNNDGTLKLTSDNKYIFTGNFQIGSYSFYTFIINRPSNLTMTGATFFGLSFNFTAPNSNLTGGTYLNVWDMSVNQNVMSVSANNVSISNTNFDVYPTHDSDYIGIDVKNANNTVIKNNIINYNMSGLLYPNYYNYVIRLVNSNNATIQNNTINAVLPFKSVNYNVTFPNIDTDLVAGIGIQSSHGFKLLNNTISIFGKSFSNSYPTLDTIIIVQSNNGIISGNVINETDTNNNATVKYLYGIDLYELSNVTISNNNITMYSPSGQVSPQGAGTAYPIQITGPVSDIFIHDNNLTTENNGPNLGIYSQNYYGTTNITIYNNFINVTGRASDKLYALVSGIELQDTYAEVYNNTIYVQNLNNYISNYTIFGISYNQTTPGNHTFNIHDNTIRTNGHYAVYLASSVNSTVNHNFLETYDLCGNNAVYAPGANITNNYCSCHNYSSTPTNCNSNRSISNNKNKKKEILAGVYEEILTDEPQTIELHVGPNTEDGNGTIENPYANLFIAWGENINKLNITSPTNIIINFMDGTYSFTREDFEIIEERGYEASDWGFLLNSNMNITLQAVNNNSVNFTFEHGTCLPLDSYNTECGGIKLSSINIILDAESISLPGAWAFSDGKVIYEKCIFYVNATFMIGDQTNEKTLIDCIFDGKGDGILTFWNEYNLDLISINYATFYNLSGLKFEHWMDTITGMVNANYNWWGSNTPISDPYVNASIYAIYNTTINYIGNNQWEVIGKLTWNDGTDEGIERLYNMPVSLISSTGTFNETNPILKNGIFKVTYTSNNLTNEINAICDKENQTLSFLKNIDLGLSVNDIIYGEYTNVTVNVSPLIDAMLNVTVNGQIYSIKADTTTVVPITELLDIGNYTVDVVIFDAENIYSTNSTSFEVKPVLTPSNETNDTPVAPAKVNTQLNAPKVTATYNVAKKLVITLKDANGKALANKKVTVKLGSISKTLTTNSKGQVSLNIASLLPKTYTATIKFAGDNNYTASSIKSKVIVKKANIKLSTKAKTFKVKAKTKKVRATLKDNKGKVMKKTKLSFKVGKKTYIAKTNKKGVATFKVKLTKKGKYTGTVKFAGNKYFKTVSKKVKITIK